MPAMSRQDLLTRFRAMIDAGRPIMISDPDGPHAAAYLSAAEAIVTTLQRRTTRVAPAIVME